MYSKKTKLNRIFYVRKKWKQNKEGLKQKAENYIHGTTAGYRKVAACGVVAGTLTDT